MTPNVVVLGGGYGGIRLAKELDAVALVTLVDPKDTFVHNIAAWRALVDPTWLDRIFLPYDRLLEHGRFVQSRAVAVEPRRVTLASGEVLEPDYLVLATGSSYAFPAKSADDDAQAARTRWRRAHATLVAARSVVVIGAGPAGLELAGEIAAFFPDKRVTITDRATDILQGPYEPALRAELRRQLAEVGVALRLATHADEAPNADVTYACTGARIDTAYLRDSLAATCDGDGRVQVNEHLRVAGADHVFAIGDVAATGRSMASLATAQAAVAAANIHALIDGRPEMQAYEAPPPAIAITLGPRGGAGQSPARGLAGPDVIAELKGRSLLLDSTAGLFARAAPARA